MLDQETAEDFLKIASNFKLGCLLTEQQNPQTIGLSQLAKSDLSAAINLIKKLDHDTMKILQGLLPHLQNMYVEVNETLEHGGRIFMCGCGATGRLALVLETIWRQECQQIGLNWENRTCAFMAGGDAALIKSVEDFQDHPEFAHQQLVELGFGQNDLLIGSTEGGETPWVIGAIWKAVEISKRKPFILYGNTDQILISNVERSREFIQSPKIQKINCNVGHMALAGSTRMQSTTILMHAIGLTLLGCDRIRNKKYPQKTWKIYAEQNINNFLNYLDSNDFTVIKALIDEQTQLYKKGESISYITDQYYAISILTDTTERSPTFSLLPFKNKYTNSETYRCWCNLVIDNKNSKGIEDWDKKVEADWNNLLGGRQIRGLDTEYWSKYKEKVSNHVILGFGLHETYENTLCIEYPMKFVSKNNTISLPPYPTTCRLSQHSLIKVLLNNLSTLIMGRMDRYESNIMTYVKPTNYKLIDRATRYVQMLRPQTKYQQIVKIIYSIRFKIKQDDPIVLKVIQILDNQ